MIIKNKEISKTLLINNFYTDMNRELYEFEIKLLNNLISESSKSLLRNVYSITIHKDRIKPDQIHSINIRLCYDFNEFIGDDA